MAEGRSAARAASVVLTAAATVPPSAISAVVLAKPEAPLGRVSPLDQVLGLPVVLRTALTLQAAGVTRITMVVEEGDAATAAAVAGDRRLRVPVEVIAAPSRLAGLARACAAATEPLLAAPVEVLADPQLYRDLAAAPLAVDGRRRLAVTVVVSRGRAPLGPLLAAPALADALAGREGSRLADVLGALLDEGAVVPLELRDTGAPRYFGIDTPERRRRAEDALLDGCRKPVDGLVARHLNRPVSLFLSRRLAGTPVTPNAITFVTLLIAVAGALSAARGGYGPMLLGAALLQAASILDGVDGELARLRFQQSRLGQWLDTVVDDLSTLLFYAGVTASAARGPHGAWLAACGGVAMGSLVLTSLQYYAELRRLGSGDFYALDWSFLEREAVGARARLVRLLHLLLKRDFFTLLYLALAVAGALPLALPIAAAGHATTLVAATARTLSRRGRAPGP